MRAVIQASLAFITIIFCAIPGRGQESVGVGEDVSPIDPNATLETEALFLNLRRIAKDKILFGHQHTTCYGIGWKNDDDRSDVRDVTGSFPAVYGWDIGHLGTAHIGKLIIDAFHRGGVNTISWHMTNIVTGGAYHDTSGETVKAILPGGTHHDKLKEKLDAFAGFMLALKDSEGIQVPIIFRPWHEHTLDAFWWGSSACTPDEFVTLWHFTVEYLRDEKGIHNLLWAYSPHETGIGSEHDYQTNRFPGYEYMDVLGVDVYSTDDTRNVVATWRIVVSLAEEHRKVPVLTEFGVRGGLSNTVRNDWYMECFLRELKKDPIANRIAWALTWRNANANHFWVPYPGHPAVQDFRRFYEDPITVFEDGLPDMYALPDGQGS